jgi:hypothetical protein
MNIDYLRSSRTRKFLTALTLLAWLLISSSAHALFTTPEFPTSDDIIYLRIATFDDCPDGLVTALGVAYSAELSRTGNDIILRLNGRCPTVAGLGIRHHDFNLGKLPAGKYRILVPQYDFAGNYVQDAFSNSIREFDVVQGNGGNNSAIPTSSFEGLAFLAVILLAIARRKISLRA